MHWKALSDSCETNKQQEELISDLYPKFGQFPITAKNEQLQTRVCVQQPNHEKVDNDIDARVSGIDNTGLSQKAKNSVSKIVSHDLNSNLVEEEKNEEPVISQSKHVFPVIFRRLMPEHMNYSAKQLAVHEKIIINLDHEQLQDIDYCSENESQD